MVLLIVLGMGGFILGKPFQTNQPKSQLTFEQMVWKKRIDAAMAPSDCPPVQKVEYPSSYYQGPLIDTHYHIPHLPESTPGEEDDEEDEEDSPEPVLGKNVKISEIACNFQHEGTTRNFALFFVYPELSHQAQVEVVKETLEQYPELFTPFINPPQPDDVRPTVEAEVLSEMLAIYPGLFQGWGEIHLDPFLSTHTTDFPPDLPLFTKIYPIIRKHQMMIWMHPGENQADNFEHVLQQNPDINFIVHGDQIKDDVGNLMSKYPNIYFCINDLYGDQQIFNGKTFASIFNHKTKELFFASLKDYEPLIQKDLRTWKGLIEAHPDQVMWCLDRDEAVLWTFDRDVGLKLVDYGRAFIGRLDPAVQENFAYKNAERLFKER